jgi:hypothetical protein
MRRCVVAILFAGLVPMSLAETSTAADRDFVRGVARHLGADPPFPVIQVQINARSDASGHDPRGRVVAKIKTLDVWQRARVTCLHVIGNRATIGTEIVTASDPTAEGQGQLWSVVDNGQTGGTDRIAGFPITPEPPTRCPPLFFNVPVVAGNYVIGDAVP